MKPFLTVRENGRPSPKHPPFRPAMPLSKPCAHLHGRAQRRMKWGSGLGPGAALPGPAVTALMQRPCLVSHGTARDVVQEGMAARTGKLVLKDGRLVLVRRQAGPRFANQIAARVAQEAP